jgi:hypothetical protein
MKATVKVARDHVFYERVEEHVEKLRALSPEEQTCVRERMGWVEQGGLLEAEITIHCQEGRDKDFPRVTIRHHDGTWETIDIIRTIENNALSIGHPAILLAINLWEQTIRCQRVLNPTRRRWRKTRNEKTLDESYKLAKRHLERVGKALVEGAKSRAMSKFDVFKADAQIHDSDYELLRLAWEGLGDNEIKKIRNSDIRLSSLKQKMVELYKAKRHLNPPSDFVMRSTEEWMDRIIEFIKDRGLHRKRRITWAAMRNKFDAWRFGLDEKTVRTYNSLGKDFKMKEGSTAPFLWYPESPASFFVSELGKWLSFPIILADGQFIDPNVDDYYASRHSPEYLAESKSYDEYWQLLFEAECSSAKSQQ